MRTTIQMETSFMTSSLQTHHMIQIIRSMQVPVSNLPIIITDVFFLRNSPRSRGHEEGPFASLSHINSCTTTSRIHVQPRFSRLFSDSTGVAYGFQPLGFAAAASAGLILHTEAPTASDIGLLSQWYLSNITAVAKMVGLPAGLVFTHLGGNDPPYPLHVAFSSAFTSTSSPGWSFYQ